MSIIFLKKLHKKMKGKSLSPDLKALLFRAEYVIDLLVKNDDKLKIAVQFF